MFDIIKRYAFIIIIAIPIFTIPKTMAQEIGHLHHVHMNVSDIQQTVEFYSRIFGAAPVSYNNMSPALLLERSFLFMTEIEGAQIINHQLSGLTHVSWSTVDGNQKSNWLKQQGVEFYTPVSELLEGSTYMYLYGPDREVVEIFDIQRHNRFNHIHMVAEDSFDTAQWFFNVVNPGVELEDNGGFYGLNIDNIAVSFFAIGARFTPRENTGPVIDTDGTHLDHIAFSFRDLDAAFERIKGAGNIIEAAISMDEDYGFRHFFSRAPNGVLVEFVEASPWPESAWE